MPEVSGRGRGARTWLAAVLVAFSCLLTACGGSGGGSERASASPGCVAGSATVTHHRRDAAVRDLCVRSGTTVTVVLEPRPEGSWPQPRSSNPMLALVTSTATDSNGVTRVTVRAARTGSVSITWGPRSAPVSTLRLSVAAYPVQ